MATATRSTASSTCRSASRCLSALPATPMVSAATGTTGSTASSVGGTDDMSSAAASARRPGPFEWVVRADYAKITGDGIHRHRFRSRTRSRRRPAASIQARSWRSGHQLQRPQAQPIRHRRTSATSSGALTAPCRWDVGGGSTLRLIDSYREWKNEQLDGDVVFTPAPDRFAHRQFRIPRARTTNCSSSRRRKSGSTAASIWSPASITSTKVRARRELPHELAILQLRSSRRFALRL